MVKILGPFEVLAVPSCGSSFGRTFSFSEPVDTTSAAEVLGTVLDCKSEERSSEFECG